jgi:hypothetical protein
MRAAANHREAPLGVYLRAIARPVSDSRLIRARKSRKPVQRSTPHPPCLPRRTAADKSRLATSLDRQRFVQVREVFQRRPSGLTGRELRLWISRHCVGMSLDQLTAMGVA